MLDFDEQFHIVPIVYNDIFKKTRERANADFAAFTGAVLGSIDSADAASKASVKSELDKYANLIGAGGDKDISPLAKSTRQGLEEKLFPLTVM